ncbi:MAG: hypothetical protein HY059_13570 [Proteobacteria bacterium]|nr:hypothetical protein [Pseudomonadota bacterium]
MESRDFLFACTATLTANEGRERLASRSFAAVDVAGDWALTTAARLKQALGGSYGQVEVALGIVIEGRLHDDPDGRMSVVFSGTLAEASEKLASQIRHFESETIPRLRANAAERRKSKRGAILRKSGLVAGVALFAGLVLVVYRYVPPILDPERAAEEILARPPPEVAGRWALGQTTANCETNYVEFAARRYEAVVGGNRQRFAAAYSQSSDSSMRVEYAEGGIKLAQIFRLGPEPGRMSIAGVESSIPEIENAARRAIGTWLTKCPDTAR